MFPEIVANEQKRIERETQEKIKKVEELSEAVLTVLKEKDLDLSEAAMVLRVVSDKINKKGGAQKLASIF